jgi:plasmid stabilization system protein ParE
MKLRYERGALADLDEIFAYIAADSRERRSDRSLRAARCATATVGRGVAN